MSAIGLSVLVPCLNEAANLSELVSRMHATFAAPELGDTAPEIVLVDDGSRDGTQEEIARLQTMFSVLRAARHAQSAGIPAAWRTALAHARGDIVCVIDGDLQYQPEEIPRMWRALSETGADIVQGVRSRSHRPRDARLVLSRGLSWLLNRTFGMSLRDNKSGFFICRRSVLQALLDVRGAFRHWQCFVMVAAHHHGYRIHEVETPFLPRRKGRSAFGDVPLGATWAVARDLPAAWREYRPNRAGRLDGHG